MTMEASEDFKGSDRNHPPGQNKRARDLGDVVRRHGAGLYAEVRPIGEIRSLTLDTPEDSR